MGSTPTLAELAARVAELEARDSRAAALAKSNAVELVSAPDTTPMRDAFEVRSELTRALIGRHDEKGDAHDEADRLNDECRRQGIRHLGEPMRYEVVPVRVVDEAAARAIHITELTELVNDTTAPAEVRERAERELAGLTGGEHG